MKRENKRFQIFWSIDRSILSFPRFLGTSRVVGGSKANYEWGTGPKEVDRCYLFSHIFLQHLSYSLACSLTRLFLYAAREGRTWSWKRFENIWIIIFTSLPRFSAIYRSIDRQKQPRRRSTVVSGEPAAAIIFWKWLLGLYRRIKTAGSRLNFPPAIYSFAGLFNRSPGSSDHGIRRSHQPPSSFIYFENNKRE